MRAEIFDRFTGRLHGTVALDGHGVAVPDRGARWIFRDRLYVGHGPPDEHGRRHALTPADGELFLRGLVGELSRGTYSTAVLVHGDEELTDRERADAGDGLEVAAADDDDDGTVLDADGLPVAFGGTIIAGPRAGERIRIEPHGRE